MGRKRKPKPKETACRKAGRMMRNSHTIKSKRLKKKVGSQLIKCRWEKKKAKCSACKKGKKNCCK